jgi:phosphotransacetylase
MQSPNVHFQSLMDLARRSPAARTAVAWPYDTAALDAALAARAAGLMDPVLVGSEAAIRAAASNGGFDLSGVTIESIADAPRAAARCVALAAAGEVAAIMKGSLHTDELMAAVVARDGGLRTPRRVSHAFAMGLPHFGRLLFITDAAVNIAPDLEAKRDIVQNAIEFAISLGMVRPRVAILAAVETVNPKMQSTLDAAALCKMADRGQIRGGVLDGPLAFDNAISPASARTKGIASEVAGAADILVVPSLEAGNMLYKGLAYMADAFGGGVVLGARVPVILTSRADSLESRLAACACARIHAATQERPGG